MLSALLSKLENLIHVHDLSAKRTSILSAAKPSIGLILEKPTSENLGSLSHIGGQPRMPVSVPWPIRKNGHPLSHLAQINLADLLPYSVQLNLPKAGLLHFFVDMEDCYTDERDCSRVLFTPTNQMQVAVVREMPPPYLPQLQQRIDEIMQSRRELSEQANNPNLFNRIPEPKLPDLTLPHCPIRFVQQLTIPASRSIELRALNLEEDLYNRYFSLRQDLNSGSGHKIGGHPDSIQGCMQRQAQFFSNGAYLSGIDSFYDHPRADELMPGAFDWQLLFQLGSNKEPYWEWHNAGALFFWINRHDLDALAFERSSYFLQC